MHWISIINAVLSQKVLIKWATFIWIENIVPTIHIREHLSHIGLFNKDYQTFRKWYQTTRLKVWERKALCSGSGKMQFLSDKDTTYYSRTFKAWTGEGGISLCFWCTYVFKEIISMCFKNKKSTIFYSITWTGFFTNPIHKNDKSCNIPIKIILAVNKPDITH